MNLKDFVVSSRVRFARNVQRFPFPSKIMDKRIIDAVAQAVYGAVYGEGSYKLYSMDALDEITAGTLKEQHLISPALIQNKISSFVLGADGQISIMIGEEDLIRAQAIVKDDNIEQAFERLNAIDDLISQSLTYCFDAELGYLTACPTNLGTGMRASFMMCLPALSITKGISEIITKLARADITVRGVYGEGSEAEGYLYQVSNQKSLGISEQDILKNVKLAATSIAEIEMAQRNSLTNMHEVRLKDDIMRAYGILTNSYRMPTKEFMEKIALIKLGRDLGYFYSFDLKKLEELIIKAQPYTLQTVAGRYLDAEERDIFRSEYVGQQLKLLNIRG